MSIRVWTIPVLCLCLPACCHVNSLPGRPDLLERISVDVRVDASPRPVFTRSRSHYQRRARGGIAEANISASRFDDAIRDLSAADLAQGVIEELPRAMAAALGREPVSEGTARTRLDIVVREVQLVALDAVSPVTWVWTGHARLEDGDRDAWRDCFEWRHPAGFASVEDFATLPDEMRRAQVREAAREFARHLVHRLAAQAGLAREEP